ncbi:MAG: Glu/Leu/Phe/Val dehydrogenase, partial [Actinomycetota bacterium]|nr:Glu/Leu/Phe/Val dehydrogenase [Actinomycetota bacterium]
PAPDLGTNEQTMAWIMDTYSVNHGYTIPAVVTGKPLEIGGSLGRPTATSAGVVHTLAAAIAERGMRTKDASVAVQGFGKVGSHAAAILHEQGARVVGVSDEFGALFRAEGLDIPVLFEHVERTGSVVDFPGADAISNAELLSLDVDVLVPAAVEGVLDGETAKTVRARWVVEGANGPTTAAGDEVLAEQGVVVVPDILANAGGVVVSYFEWVQANQAYWWTLPEIEEKLADRMRKGYADVANLAQRQDLSLRDAALCIGVRRVAEAHEIRGLYP